MKNKMYPHKQDMQTLFRFATQGLPLGPLLYHHHPTSAATTPLNCYVHINNSWLPRFSFFRLQKARDKQKCFLLLWPLPWPNDLDMWTWPDDTKNVYAYQRRHFTKLKHYKQTDTQISVTENVSMPLHGW